MKETLIYFDSKTFPFSVHSPPIAPVMHNVSAREVHLSSYFDDSNNNCEVLVARITCTCLLDREVDFSDIKYLMNGWGNDFIKYQRTCMCIIGHCFVIRPGDTSLSLINEFFSIFLTVSRYR